MDVRVIILRLLLNIFLKSDDGAYSGFITQLLHTRNSTKRSPRLQDLDFPGLKLKVHLKTAVVSRTSQVNTGSI